MTPEQLEEVPGIGEKTVEKISVAVRHYFGQYEEGEERPARRFAAASEAGRRRGSTKDAGGDSGGEAGSDEAKEILSISTEDIEAAEEADSDSDAFSDADAREERIELDNDTVD